MDCAAAMLLCRPGSNQIEAQPLREEDKLLHNLAVGQSEHICIVIYTFWQ